MGLFDKLKNILFEEEDETESFPDYSNKKEEKSVSSDSIVDEPISTTDNTRFKNVKRDIDLYAIEDDVLSEVPASPVVQEPAPVAPVPEVKQVPLEPKEEPKSVFQTFDEAEFERLNSHIINNENKARRDSKIREEVSVNQARRANSNYSSTSAPSNREKDTRDPNRYRLDFEPVGKKPFRPSPVISPVYGILDKNYSKDDIVDKKDGMKRERIKPIITRTQDIPSKVNDEDEIVSVNVDDVRKKAFGAIDYLDNNSYYDNEIKEDDIPTLNEEKTQESTPTFEEELLRDLEQRENELQEIVDVEEPIIDNDDRPLLDDEDDFISNIEEELEDTKSYEDVAILDEEVKPEKIDKSHIMDDMEKTSTLQILDDIERELNSIKPTSSSYDDDERSKLERNETLENDLFDLIDSMYEEGEEEDND